MEGAQKASHTRAKLAVAAALLVTVGLASRHYAVTLSSSSNEAPSDLVRRQRGLGRWGWGEGESLYFGKHCRRAPEQSSPCAPSRCWFLVWFGADAAASSTWLQ